MFILVKTIHIMPPKHFQFPHTVFAFPCANIMLPHISVISLSDTDMTEHPLRYTIMHTLLQKMKAVPFAVFWEHGTVPVGDPVGGVLGAHSVSITMTAAA